MHHYHVSITRKKLWFRYLPLFLALQFSTLLFCYFTGNHSILDMISYLDANWYYHLSTNGYSKPSWMQAEGGQFAFLPFWPYFISFLHSLSLELFHPILVGAIVSIGFFLLTLLLLRRQSLESRQTLGLTPKSPGGWFLLLFFPGSWVYLSNHTESLFLFLSVSGFLAAFHRKAFLAGLLVGIAALTRNQGTILALCVGISFLLQFEIPLKRRLQGFCTVGVLSLGSYALWLLYQFRITGSVWASASAQNQWSMASGITEYISNMMWLSPNNGFRALVFWVSICIGAMLVLQKKYPFSKALGLYVFLSALLWPLQGNNFPQAYRFGVVLFPVLFVLGDYLHLKLLDLPFPKKTSLALASGIFLFWGIRITYFYYGQTGWPY